MTGLVLISDYDGIYLQDFLQAFPFFLGR